MRLVWFAALLAACSGGTSSVAAVSPSTARASSNGSPNGLPVGPPLVTPEERMTYRVQLQGVELAAMTLSVGGVTELDGRSTIVVQGHARSVGLAKLVAKVDDRFTSWIDVQTGRSVRFAVDEYETNSDVNIEHTVADLAGRSADTLPITFHLNDAAPSPEPQKLTLPEVWDYNGFLVMLRGWEAAPGTVMAFEVLRSRFLWHVDLTIKGKTKLVTELGELPALRFDGHTYKLTRKGERFPDSDARNFSIWISDDDGRVPLLLVARTDYGDVKMEIVEYHPGTGLRVGMGR